MPAVGYLKGVIQIMATKKGVATKVAAGVKKAASSDVIFATAQEVENLTAAKAFVAVDELSNDIEQNSFKLGGVLSLIQAKAEEGDEAFLGEAKSFRDLCDTKFGLHYRKVMYLIGIYRNLVEKQIPYTAVAGLGWTKIAAIAPVITVKNVELWVNKAKKLTYIQLLEAVAKAKNKGSNATESEGDSTVTTITFKLHKDQKAVVREALDKVKSETGTEVDSVGITNLCTGYLGGSVEIPTTGGEAPAPAKKPTKKQKKEAVIAVLKEMGLDDALEAFGEAFPDVTIEATVPD